MTENLKLMFSPEFFTSIILPALIGGIAVTICASLLGVTLVLKKYSMIGDGLSHIGYGALSVAAVMNLAPLKVALPVVIIAAFILLIVLMVLTGPKDEDGVRRLYASDRVWTEVQLGAFGLAVFGACLIGSEVLQYIYMITDRQAESGALQHFPSSLSGSSCSTSAAW